MFTKTVRTSFALFALLAVSACGNSHDAASPVAGTGNVQPETIAEAAAPAVGFRAQIVDAESFSAITFAAPELTAARAELMLVTRVVQTENTVELRTDSESIAIFDMANGGVVMSHRGALAGAVAHIDMNGEALAAVHVEMPAGEEHMNVAFAVMHDDGDQAGQGQDQNQAQAQEQAQQEQKEECKDEAKTEDKKEESKPEEKKEEGKEETKADVKDEGKTEGKTEGKEESKKEEGKEENKTEDKKEESKDESKSEVKDEGKTEGKEKEESKTEDKKEDTKSETKDEGKEEGKKEEAKK
jgi:hypothetical protein